MTMAAEIPSYENGFASRYKTLNVQLEWKIKNASKLNTQKKVIKLFNTLRRFKKYIIEMCTRKIQRFQLKQKILLSDSQVIVCI